MWNERLSMLFQKIYYIIGLFKTVADIVFKGRQHVGE